MRDTVGSIVVTGAAGFIGSHLAASLVGTGYRVIGVDADDSPHSRSVQQTNLQRIVEASHGRSDRFHSFACDVRLRDDVHRLFESVQPVAVFHLAAKTGVRASIADPAGYVATNVMGWINVLEAARAVGCQNAVFASSSSVYGNRTDGPFAEDDPADDPISPYAATKRTGELIAQTYAHCYGMRIAALRLFTVYGPAQRPDLAIARFKRLIAAGEEVPMYGDGTTARDYTYIDDIIRGVLAAHNRLCAPIQSSIVDRQSSIDNGFFRIWNLGHSRPITLREMIDAVARVVGKPAHIMQLPMQPGDVPCTWADLTRSMAELNYSPKTTFEDGLRRQWDWMRQADSVSGHHALVETKAASARYARAECNDG